jgi:hypothetical protein
MANKNNKEIQFGLVKIKELSSFEKSLSDLEINEFLINKVGFIRNFSIDFNDSEGIMDIVIDIKFVYKIEDKQSLIDLFGIKTLTQFKFINYKDKIKFLDDETLDIPDDLMINLLSISYSGTRGMMVCLTNKSDYEDLILPLIRPEEFKEIFKP